METYSDDHDFWRQQGLENQLEPTAGDHDPLPEELEELLWQFARSELSPAEETRMLTLASQHPGAATRLHAIHAALEAAEGYQSAVPAEAAWQRVSQHWPQPARAGLGLWNLIVELTARGLHLVQSSGQPAFAGAIPRGETTEAITSLVHDYLTSVGIIRVTVDLAPHGRACRLSVEPRQLSPRVRHDQLSAALLTPDGAEVAALTFRDARGEVNDDVSPGAYLISLRRQGEELARLALEIRLPLPAA